MKKRILSIAVVAAAWSFNQSSNEVALSDVALSNVEALANSESSDEFTDATGCEAVQEKVKCVKGNIEHLYAQSKN